MLQAFDKRHFLLLGSLTLPSPSPSRDLFPIYGGRTCLRCFKPLTSVIFSFSFLSRAALCSYAARVVMVVVVMVAMLIVAMLMVMMAMVMLTLLVIEVVILLVAMVM